MDFINKEYSFASGGVLWKVIDQAKPKGVSLRQHVFFVLGILLLCWVPIAVLSLFNLGFEKFYLLFVRDVATQVRFLFVLPILIFSRRYVNTSFNSAIHFFYESGIVDQTNEEEFQEVTDRIEALSETKMVDLVLLFVVYFTVFIQENSRVHNVDIFQPWYYVDDHVTIAGWWYMVLSLPLLKLVLYRWFYTLFLWVLFLKRLAGINLNLSSLHPDGVGGLGFLQYTQISFFPVALAFSALTAGVLNNLIIFSGISIIDYKIAIGSVVLIILCLFIFPLMLFTPLLAKVKRANYMSYSLQAWPVARKFQNELEEFYKTEEENPDTSLHVDMIGSFEKTKEMKVYIVDRMLLATFAIAVVLPFLPVIAQQIPLKEVFLNFFQKALV